MKNVSRLVLMMLAVVLLAAPALAAEKATVNDLVIALAQAKNLNATDGPTALASLKAVGIAVPPIALNKQLTEHDVTAIAAAAGLQVTTSNPSAPFSSAQINSFIATFGPELGRDSTRPMPTANPNSSHGKKKGHNKSKPEPL